MAIEGIKIIEELVSTIQCIESNYAMEVEIIGPGEKESVEQIVIESEVGK